MALPRRLHFVVGTGLLGASLSLGCTGGKPDETKKADDAKKVDKPEPDRINTGPVPEPPPPQPLPLEPPSPQPIHVNEGPIEPPPPPELKVNPGPDEKAPEPQQVNTRPTDI